MKKLKTKIAAFKGRLTSVGHEEPLNRLSLTVIILLDFFVLSLLFTGLHEHTQQLTTANEYMPHAAREIFIDQSWSSANRISKLQPLILSNRNNYHYRYNSPFEKQTIKLMHPAAQDFYRRAKAISENKILHSLFLKRQKLTEERSKTERAFEEAKKSYDTQLLENIANATKGSGGAVSTTAREYSQNINRLTGEIRETEKQIHEDGGIQQLWTIISPNDAARQKIVSDTKRFEFWFPLKELCWQLLFLLPIFGIFYVWSSRSVKKDNAIQTLISSHLLVITFLPILLKVIELVVDIIPKHFFRNLFKFLQSLHLMALWHYFVIFAAIAVGLFLIYIIQKKVFNRQKVMQKRLAKGACIRCNKHLPAQAKFCPACGTGQLTLCPACGKETPLGGACCIYCGTKK